ncbi:histidinol-phosphate transaminase [Pseudoteredinibacter isoporae]|uniref:histidinol-phosphate transaminase n=1 Tax=Pseudoteredinibacter isoporae TaxID=570281 RepID=UPI00310876CB
MSKLSPAPGVAKLAPYKQGQSQIDGVENPIKLSSNESSHGPSPAALKAYEDVAKNLNRYPDGSQYELRKAIGETYQLDPNRIVCGNGSDELIQLMVRAYVRPGDEALLSENGFIMSNIHCVAQGAELVIAPEKDYKVDVDALLARVTDKTRFCTIANPNNPTGTFIESSELRRLHAGLPEDCLLLIDDAYAEYVWDDNYEDGSALVDEFDNVVMTRTFSKIYGLPALRIGWAYCPESIVDASGRIRTPFNTNASALAAAAAAVRDTEFVAKVKAHNKQSLERIQSVLGNLGIEVIPSQTNFYLLKFPQRSGKSGAAAAQHLMSRGIIPRPAGGDDQYLRISVGLDSENDAVLTALTEYMEQ